MWREAKRIHSLCLGGRTDRLTYPAWLLRRIWFRAAEKGNGSAWISTRLERAPEQKFSLLFNTLARWGRPSHIIIIDYLIRHDSWEISGESKLNRIFAATVVKETSFRLIRGSQQPRQCSPAVVWPKGLPGTGRRFSSCEQMDIEGGCGAKHHENIKD